VFVKGGVAGWSSTVCERGGAWLQIKNLSGIVNFEECNTTIAY